MEYNKVKVLLGKKFYSYLKDDDSIDIVRVVSIKNESQITIKFEDEREEKISPETLLKKYIELIPDGFITFSQVKMKKVNKETFTDDVIVCLHKTGDLEKGDNDPAILCRQNITDFFYNYISNTENHEQVGVCASKKTIPANIDYSMLRACDDVTFFVGINFYITDSLDEILNLLGSRIKKFNTVLENGLLDYFKYSMKLDIGQKQVNGWCRDLKTLLINNDFVYDYNEAFNIIPSGLDMDDHILNKEDLSGSYKSFDDFAIKNFSDLYKINITKTIVIEYAHDINLDEVAGKYFLVRDINNKLYLVLYTTDGEYFDNDLAAEAAKNIMLQSGILTGSKYKNKK